MYQLCVLVVFGMTLWLSARLSSGKMVCSDAEQLVELAHVDVSIFLCILIVVILVHPDAYVDARFLMLVLAQGLAVHRLVHFSLFLSLLIIVNDLKLDGSWPH